MTVSIYFGNHFDSGISHAHMNILITINLKSSSYLLCIPRLAIYVGEMFLTQWKLFSRLFNITTKCQVQLNCKVHNDIYSELMC